jgi:hypothetical protein
MAAGRVTPPVPEWAWLPERGVIAQLRDDGSQILWERSRLTGTWRPLGEALDPWWRRVGRADDNDALHFKLDRDLGLARS